MLLGGCRFDDPIRPDISPWEYASPASVGFNEDILLGLDSLFQANYFAATSMIVLKDDRLVYENYYKFNTRDSLQRVSSIGNALVSLLLGFAIEDGYVASVEDSIYTYLDEYSQYFAADSLKKGILFRHVLLMRSGLSWNETLLSPLSAENDYNIVKNRSPDRVGYLLSKPMESLAGQRYSQNSAAPLLIVKAIESKLGFPVEEYLDQKLFSPLGIENWSAEKDSAGLANLAFGLRMKPLDLAKIGHFALRKGHWQGRELLPQDWMEISTATHHQIDNFLDIGYLWWRFSANSGWDIYFPENDAFYAASDDDQYLFVIPSHDMVFVLTTPERNSFNSNIGYFLLSNYLLRHLQPASGN